MKHDASEIVGSRVLIDYHVALHYDVDGPSDFIFLIHPARTPHQDVRSESLRIEPNVAHTLDSEPVTGNRLLKLQAPAGPLDVSLDAQIVVTHHIAEPAHVHAIAPAELPSSTLRYLVASRYCQTDQLQNQAWAMFGHLPRGYAQVQAVADWVRSNVEFKVGTSHCGTSSIDTLNNRVGVCRDFAHLMIGFCRSLNYPARFATAVDYGAEPSLGPPDFHAYAEVYLDRWYLFDATGISPTTGLIRIATGRDAADVSFATIFGPVRTGMPIVRFDAIEDPAAGIALPRRTALAVSTATI
jgi:transglutaminase-like putative cysteine protease